MMIRPYKDKDYKEVKNILQQGGHFDDVWDSRSHWKRKIEKDKQSILIAQEGDEIIGCILLIIDEWTCFLFRLAVKESKRKQGAGSLLVSSAERYLKQVGCEEVAIFVDEDDSSLQQYYKKRGYLKGGKYRCLYKNLSTSAK